MPKRTKLIEHKGTVSGLIDEGLSELQSLGEEMRSWYDGMPENLQSGGKGETVSQSADTLENLPTEIEVPESAAEAEVVYHLPKPKKRPPSRATRRDAAVNLLEIAKGRLEELQQEQDEEDFDTPINELDEAISAASDVEFPGMYG